MSKSTTHRSRVWQSESATLGDFFTIKRGVETGDNDFFILTPIEIMQLDLPLEFLRPILPSPHVLDEEEIVGDAEGNPILEEKLFLLDCPLPEREVRERYPLLWNYFERGMSLGVHERSSCRRRTPWYAQERRPPAQFLCAFIGRDTSEEAPFRFILNHSKATAANVFLLMYPKSSLARAIGEQTTLAGDIWKALNGIGREEYADRERVYGDDAFERLEPNELASVPASRIVDLVPDVVPDSAAQLTLFDLQ